MRSQALTDSADFGLGAVVVPARNGLLSDLGHDIASLGRKALGIVIDSKSNKCLVQFPALQVTLWLTKEEMADVEAHARAGETAFAKLKIALISAAESPGDEGLVWWVAALVERLPVTHVLGIEKGVVKELWDESPGAELPPEIEAAAMQAAFRVSLGVSEMDGKKIIELEKFFGRKLISLRLLPSGMHKLECRFLLALS